MMVGREVNLVVEKEVKVPGDVVVSIQDLVVVDKFKNIVVDHVSLEVRSGEIVGATVKLSWLKPLLVYAKTPEV